MAGGEGAMSRCGTLESRSQMGDRSRLALAHPRPDSSLVLAIFSLPFSITTGASDASIVDVVRAWLFGSARDRR